MKSTEYMHVFDRVVNIIHAFERRNENLLKESIKQLN
jgi:hypothetical protein